MIKEEYEKLNNIQRIQIYIIIAVFCYIVFYYFTNFIDTTKLQIKNDNHNLIARIDTGKIRKIDIKEMILYLEKMINSYEVELDSLRVNNSIMTLRIQGETNNLKHFLKEAELHFKIIQIQIEKLPTIQVTTLLINNRYLFNENLQNEVTTFKKQSLIRSDIKAKKKLIGIDAIVLDEVLIDGKWYKKNMVYDKYKIINIDKKMVEFKIINTQEIIKVELKNEHL